MTDAAGDSWPTPNQTLLLQAVLLDGPPGRIALERWQSRVELGQLDRGSRNLLPLLYQRLLAEGPDGPLLQTLRGASDRAEAQNRELIESTASGIRTLQAAGIDAILLKGMALIARGFIPAGARPMADGDVLVPESQALRARDVLMREGWRLEGRLDATLLPIRHAVGFRNPSGRQCDLHWHVLADCCETGSDADFWAAAEPTTLNGVAVRTLCPADMLLHACVHGTEWSIVPPVRWAADAVLTIRGAGQRLNWERVVEQAERRVLTLPMFDTLRYLQEKLRIPVPASALTRLAHATVPGWARAAYRIKRRRRSPLRQFLFHWYHHRRLSASSTLAGAVVRFPLYLERRFQPIPRTLFRR